jgi:hypothetical protein
LKIKTVTAGIPGTKYKERTISPLLFLKSLTKLFATRCENYDAYHQILKWRSSFLFTAVILAGLLLFNKLTLQKPVD